VASYVVARRRAHDEIGAEELGWPRA